MNAQTRFLCEYEALCRRYAVIVRPDGDTMAFARLTRETQDEIGEHIKEIEVNTPEIDRKGTGEHRP